MIKDRNGRIDIRKTGIRYSEDCIVCGHKKSLHHANRFKPDSRKCYGIGCICKIDWVNSPPLVLERTIKQLMDSE